MSTSFFFSFGLLISFLLCISCSPIHRPVNAISYEEKNPDNSNEDDDIPLLIYPKSLSMDRLQRTSQYYPRASRNSWFRVSTYQHMKPTGGSEEKPSGDKLMRWG
jgi:hypothetical protein